MFSLKGNTERIERLQGLTLKRHLLALSLNGILFIFKIYFIWAEAERERERRKRENISERISKSFTMKH